MFDNSNWIVLPVLSVKMFVVVVLHGNGNGNVICKQKKVVFVPFMILSIFLSFFFLPKVLNPIHTEFTQKLGILLSELKTHPPMHAIL
jgi:hypothetical protein